MKTMHARGSSVRGMNIQRHVSIGHEQGIGRYRSLTCGTVHGHRCCMMVRGTRAVRNGFGMASECGGSTSRMRRNIQVSRFREAQFHEWKNKSAMKRNMKGRSLVSAVSSMKTDEECDVIVIGSGIGGLSCAGLLARYGVNVTVLESHSVPGGAAHTWERKTKSGTYHFESGPSLYSGMASRGTSANPLSLVLQAIDEPLDLLEYNTWNVITPETPNGYPSGVGPDGFDALVRDICGADALPQWRRLQEEVAPLSRAAASIPPMAIRLDPGVVISTFGRYFPSVLENLTALSRMTAPFAKVMDAVDAANPNTPLAPFIRNYVNLLCFLLSGLPADGTITAETAFMFNEWFNKGARLEFPRGGSAAMVDALVRGVTKRGNGRVCLNSHVDEIIVENNKAVGVRIKGGGVLRAKRAVVSNASTPDTLKLLKNDASIPKGWKNVVQNTPINPSFMHLHVGFDASGLDDIGLHHIVVNSWDNIDGEQNVVLISIASVIDPSLAPPGKHTLHAYLPATEPWELWSGLDRKSQEYRDLKTQRAEIMWRAIERVIPDIRERTEISTIGTPLTHARYLRRYKGSYGAAWKAGESTFPFGNTPIKGLWCCGDFAFPGIGLPAVAASGAIVANSLVPLEQHLELLESLEL